MVSATHLMAEGGSQQRGRWAAEGTVPEVHIGAPGGLGSA